MAFIVFGGRVECIISIDVQPGCDEIAYTVLRMLPAYVHPDLVVAHPFDDYDDHGHINIRGTGNSIACISLEVEVWPGLLGPNPG